MRKLLFVFPIMLLLGIVSTGITSCKDSKKGEAEESDSTDVVATDSLGLNSVAVVDSTPVSELEKLINEKPMPKAADELFDDFFFNFSNNRNVQKARIVWPLNVITNGEKTTMNEGQWVMEKFYAENGFYVMLLDDERQTKLAKDTSLSDVAVIHVDIPQNKLESFNFNRIDGKWRMTSLERDSLSESKNAGFLRFYQKFATDSLFCKESLAENITFTGPNLDEEEEGFDENTTSTRSITPEEFFELSPELAADFYAVAYGQKEDSSNNKVFIMRLPASSQECKLYFRRSGSQWKLYKLEV
ncbi:MAG: DUF4348 domain-containing protein [Bacteroidaceae bacterium]|nr:DUF4348 domain-containing protein [Bacteroidaceae bacterium]